MTKYNDAVNKMGKLLKERNVCLHSRKAHENCYTELREYLHSVNKQYSHAEARKWLMEVVRNQESSAGFQAKWNYMEQLEELINTGTVLQDHLLLTKSNYQKLSELWKSELDRYLQSCEKKHTKRTNELIKIHCSRFLLFLQSQGINSVQEISCEKICDFFEYEMPVNTESRYLILSNSRLFLQYYVSIGECEPVLPMLLEKDVYKYAVLHNKDSLDTFADLQKTGICKTQDVYHAMDGFVQEFEKLGYKNTVKYNAAHVIKCLYAFLSVNHLNYNIQITELWYNLIKSVLGNSYHSWIRIINLFDLYIRRQKFNLYPCKYYSQ